MSRGIRTLIFPPACMNCGSPNFDICLACKKLPRPKPSFLMGENFPIASSLPYGEVTGKSLLLAKENGLISAQKFFVNALETSINHFKIEHPISIVPIPSQRKSVGR